MPSAQEKAKANGDKLAHPVLDCQETSDSGRTEYWTTGGLTKREWFAGMALQGLLACPDVRGDAEIISGYALQNADALLKALAQAPEAPHG